MPRTQHGYLHNMAVSGTVTCHTTVDGEVRICGEVELIHPEQLALLPSHHPLTYTGTCRDEAGGFHYLSVPALVHLRASGKLEFESTVVKSTVVWETQLTG